MQQLFRRIVLQGLGALLFLDIQVSAQNVHGNLEKPHGLVSDEKVAVAIAEAVLFPLYGEHTIRNEKPYIINLKEGKWIIEGSLPKSNDPNNIIMGGVFHIVISQKDGQILELEHGV